MAPLTTPTYDLSGQATHPDIYDAGAGGWNGHRYWMVMTPYPVEDWQLENPSILVSDDKEAWTVPDGLTNPVVPFVVGHKNSDPDLVVVSGTMYIIYNDASGGSESVKEVHSSDGVSWTSPATLFTVAGTACLSPAVVWNGSQFLMWSINYLTHRLERRTCATINGTWNAPVEQVYNLPYGTSELWHIDVIFSNGVYYALHNIDKNSLWLATSPNGDDWVTPSPAILPAGTTDIWDKLPYRSTIVKTETGFDMWYSARNAANEWRIGYTPVTSA